MSNLKKLYFAKFELDSVQKEHKTQVDAFLTLPELLNALADYEDDPPELLQVAVYEFKKVVKYRIVKSVQKYIEVTN